MNSEKINKGKQELFDKIKQLIQDTGQQAVVYLNQATNHLYWSIGHYILVDLKHEVLFWLWKTNYCDTVATANRKLWKRI